MGIMQIHPRARRDALFAALADPTRRGLFEKLTQKGEQTVAGLTKQAGVSQPAVSKHLASSRAPVSSSTAARAARRITASNRKASGPSSIG